MPTQVYECRLHGQFDVHTHIQDPVPATQECPVVVAFDDPMCVVCPCARTSPWVPSAPAIRVVDGTTPPR